MGNSRLTYVESGERAFKVEGTLSAKTLNPAWHVLVRVKKGSLTGSSEAGDEYRDEVRWGRV